MTTSSIRMTLLEQFRTSQSGIIDRSLTHSTHVRPSQSNGRTFYSTKVCAQVYTILMCGGRKSMCNDWLDYTENAADVFDKSTTEKKNLGKLLTVDMLQNSPEKSSSQKHSLHKHLPWLLHINCKVHAAYIKESTLKCPYWNFLPQSTYIISWIEANIFLRWTLTSGTTIKRICPIRHGRITDTSTTRTFPSTWRNT